MYAQLQPLTLSMINEDADFMYPCFHADDVERALSCMTSKLGFHRADETDLPHVYTYEAEDFRLIVMATPKVYRQDRMCYAFSGVLIKNDDWESEVEVLPQPRMGQKTSSWRKNPKDFYQDLLQAMERLQPDRCLPAAVKPKLLGPAPNTKRVKRSECWQWHRFEYSKTATKRTNVFLLPEAKN